ncbi:AMP-binding protein [uncultured Flavobacterium sp.]|uniref:AMP-binding protein n=1 Tax=uncultured Flavobacterium sp. TaxID=165435 RepID=UPI0030ED2320|tara:strand:+ start:25003 stop:26049 length:1047 start_codon:yes stop_codon:yes gene_type:complete
MTKYIPNYKNVHNKFKLNGFHLKAEDLCRVAYSFIKEGEDFEKPVGDFILDWFDTKDFIEMKTSGSTGKPKKIRIEKQAMVNSALATGDFFGLAAGDTILNCLPVQYVAGKMMFIRAFILGLEMDFVAPSSHPLETIDKQYDFTAMVPLQAMNSIDLLHNFKTIIIGGSAVSKDLEKILKPIKSNIYETYGMTETITHIAARKLGEKAFTTLPNVVLSQDENNCLLIHASAISDEIIHTNDIVELLSENKFVFLGRFDNVINSGGIKLIPEQIEAKMLPFIKNRFFVTGKADKELGEHLVLVVEGKEQPIDLSKITTLDKYEKPREVIFINKFKETATGKIIRKESLV